MQFLCSFVQVDSSSDGRENVSMLSLYCADPEEIARETLDYEKQRAAEKAKEEANKKIRDLEKINKTPRDCKSEEDVSNFS